LVGGTGVLLHLAIVSILFHRLHTAFLAAQLTGTYVAMTLNFVLNNIVTFRDRRLRGRELAAGFVSFVAACSIGAVANIGVAELLLRLRAPYLVAAAAGLVIGSVWNYAVNEVFTWRKDRRLRQARAAQAAGAAVPCASA